MSRPPGAGGGGASPASTGPGSLEPISPQGLWVEFGFLDGVHSLNDVAIWNDNEETYDQGWKHLAIQVTTDHPGDNDNPETWNWTTVFNGILPQSPGPGDGVTPAHTPGSFTLAAAVINLGGVSAAHVAFVNTGAGDEASYIKQYNNLSDPNDSDLSEVRFNSGLTAGSPPSPFQWTTDNFGSWNSTASWTGGVVPNGVGAVAKFFGKITADRTVVVDSPVTVGSLMFNNAHRYNIAGAASLTIQTSGGSGLIDVAAGAQKINLPLIFQSSTNINVAGGASLTIANPTTIKSGATVTKTGTVLIQAPLTIESGGGLMIASGPTTLTRAPGLSGSAKLDVRNNAVTIDYSGASSPAATIAAQLASGYNGGHWDGAGINSSSTIANQTALGWTDDPASHAITIKYALYGDADLSGAVDTVDFNFLTASFGQSGKGWSNGDSNYSGNVDTVDFNLLAANFAKSLPDSGAGVGGLVPEPMSGSLLLFGALGALSARRRAR